MNRVVEFGWNEDDLLNNTFAYRGSKESKVIAGEIIGFYDVDGKTYLLSRVSEAMDDSLEGTIDVREIACYSYHDGSFSLYSNNEKSPESISLEKGLNQKNVTQYLASGGKLEDMPFFQSIGFEPSKRTEQFLSYSAFLPITVTGIKPEFFEEVKASEHARHSARR